MFVINKQDKSILATRGDVVVFAVNAVNDKDNTPFVFSKHDVVRINIHEKGNCSKVHLVKDFVVTEDTESVEILLYGNDTKIGDVISKPKEYWYEVELNPDTDPQTIIGYDEDGPKIFKLYPEGSAIK